MPAPNQRLGEYILIDRIGAGAFGEVWRARHHAWAEQIVAIKIPTDLLLKLNHQRYAEEVTQGLHDKKKAGAKAKSRKAAAAGDSAQDGLF